MYLESKKIQLLQKILMIDSDSVLTELESVLRKAGLYKEKKQPTAHDFLGVISSKDAQLMDKAIEEGCEQIDPDDWK